MMKKLSSLLLSLLLVLSMLGAIPVAAEGSVSVSADKSTVTIGETVTVSATYTHSGGIGSMDLFFHYNTKSFEYVSSSPMATGSGKLKMSYYATDVIAPTSVTVTITLKAIAAGSGDFKLETGYISTDDDETALVGDVKTLSVSDNNPTKSGDANLASLEPSKGSLSPAFNKNTTRYTISVPYTVTSLSLMFSTSHDDADTAISDSNDLNVGENTRVITVTAPNGDTKTYTVVITREKEQTTTTTATTTTTTTTKKKTTTTEKTTTTSKTTTETTEETTEATESTESTEATESTTTTLPLENARVVNVDGNELLIAESLLHVDLPEGFAWSTVEINGVEMPAAKQEVSNTVLLYLTERGSDYGEFYIYTAQDDSFVLFRQMVMEGGPYTIHDLPKGETAPDGAEPGTITYDGKNMPAYIFLNPDLVDYVIVWATNPQGETGFYTYDMVEGTLQRYHVITPTTTTTAAPEEDVEGEEQPTQHTLLSFVTTYQRALLVGAAALAGLAVLLITIFLLVRIFNTRKSKH